MMPSLTALLFFLSFTLLNASPISEVATPFVVHISDESRLSGTTFTPIPGIRCPRGPMEFGTLQDSEGLGLTQAVRAVLPFSSIQVDGSTCKGNGEDDVLLFFPYYELLSRFPNAIRDVEAATANIFTTALEGRALKCGEFSSEAKQGYVFSDNIESLLPELERLGYLEHVNEEDMIPGRLWMATFLPGNQDLEERSEICLFKETGLFVEPTADPTPEAEEEEEETVEDEDFAPAPATVDDGDTVFGDAEDQVFDAEERPSCFPADAQVVTEQGVKSMEQLEVGDRVFTEMGVYSDVFMFTHKQKSGRYPFIKLTLASGDMLTVSPGHFVYVGGDLIISKQVEVGMKMEVVGKGEIKVVRKEGVWRRGLYNPQTASGSMVVENVRVSTYTKAIEAGIAHALLVPLRAVWTSLHMWTSALEGGLDGLLKS